MRLQDALMSGYLLMRNRWYRDGHIMRFMPEEELFLDTEDGTICGLTSPFMEGWEIVHTSTPNDDERIVRVDQNGTILGIE